jgi:hypothetical protein
MKNRHFWILGTKQRRNKGNKMHQDNATAPHIKSDKWESVAENDDGFNGEKALWRAIITQALMDAGSEPSKKEMIYERAQAMAWLSGWSKDFLTVCSLAGLEPEYVRQKAQEAIKRGCKWRANYREEKRRLHNKARVGQVPESKSLNSGAVLFFDAA